MTDQNENDQTSSTPEGPNDDDGGAEKTAPQDGRGREPVIQRDDRPRIVCRYGRLGHVGVFTHTKKTKFDSGSKLVLQTDRGIEIGRHIPLLCPQESSRRPDIESIRRYIDQSGQERGPRREGRVIRVASEQDLSEERHINGNAEEQLKYCRELTGRHGLPMKLITCEHLFGGERMVFYFMAEGRVDFRQLVRDLAREYQTRIEMRQVGARDEARLVADYEICGRECCCKSFLKTLRPVSMKMAKMQKATLDPSKVSGRCGRLRCCLRYEHEVYIDLNQRLARNNSWVQTDEGEGKVIDRQIITQLVTVELEDRRRVTFPMEEIEVLASKPPPRPQAPPESPDQPEKGAEQRNGEEAERGQASRRGKRHGSRPSQAKSGEMKPKNGARSDSTRNRDRQVSQGKTPPDPQPKTDKQQGSADETTRKGNGEPAASGGPPAQDGKPRKKRRSRGRGRRHRSRKGSGGKQGGASGRTGKQEKPKDNN